MRRKEKLTTGEIYHVFTKSIAGYQIFNYEEDYLRMKQMMFYYTAKETPMQFSNFINTREVRTDGFILKVQELREYNQDLVQIIAYCVMPTHIHLVLKQLSENGITKFMGKILNSYTRYFNLKRKRKGPLWVGPFKNVRVESDDQLLHLSRYVHLNPVTAGIVTGPEQWRASSYPEYMASTDEWKICNFDGLIEIQSFPYEAFVRDGIQYQKEMARIKSLMSEEPILHPRGAKW